MIKTQLRPVSSAIDGFSAVRTARLESDLMDALKRDEIEVLFQPQFACRDGAMVGAEALARWQHPALGEIGARDLFAVADRAGLVAPLSRHVVARALAIAAKWPRALGISLNITPEELAEADFARDFAAMVARSGIGPERLTLEITEDVLLTDLAAAAEALGSLKSVGFRIALDDFGAGFCNFRYLKLLPLDAIKLDRSMVEEISQDQRDLAILRAILAMAKALELDVIAEGIETEAQRDIVVSEGCTHWQGFLRAPPMSNADMLDFAAR